MSYGCGTSDPKRVSVAYANMSEMSFLARLQQGAAPPPPALREMRRELAADLLHGDGLEIGALHFPVVLPAGVSVRYVDRLSVLDLRAHYPELEDEDLVPVDVVDDGEQLSTIDAESVDFIIANHFLEHCEDPIGTIATHLSKLSPGGALFYAVPDKRYTFDFRRPSTPLEHVLADHEDSGRRSRGDHYLEWARLVYPEDEGPPDEQTARAHAANLDATRYSIHFHVWTQADLLELMLACHARLGQFDIEAVRRFGIENLIVMRKHGDVVQEDRLPAAIAPFQARIDQLERDLANARVDSENARTEVDALDQRARAQDRVLTDVFSSASWRLTKPLRTMKHAILRQRD